MRILVISQYFPPDGGGGSRRVSNALTGLIGKGHQIEVISAFPHYPHGNTPKSYRKKAFVLNTWKNMRVIRVWVPPISHSGFLRRLVMYITFVFSSIIPISLVKSPDVIWAANSNVFSSLPAIVYQICKGAPIVRNVDDLWPETAIEEGYLGDGFLAKIGKKFAQVAYRFCRVITPISNGYKREIIEKYGIPSEKIHVVEVGVDTEKFYPSKGVKSSKSHPLIILYSGILGSGYNFDYLLKVAEILKKIKNVQFVIRGFGERQKEIQRKQRDKHLDNVQLSDNFLEFAELIRVINKADILFLPMNPFPAHEAGLPTKLLEYMACGKPIICSSEGDAANLVQKAECGLVVSPHNPSDAVEAILTLQADEALRRLLGKNGRHYVERYLSIEKISCKLERVFLAVSDSGK